MTRDEFVSKKSESEQRIRCSVVPVGIIYAMRLGAVFGLIFCGVIQSKFYGTDFNKTILFALGILVALFAVSFPAARYSRRRFEQLALKCPSCQSCLVFHRASKTVETGCCYHCGKRVFDVPNTTPP